LVEYLIKHLLNEHYDFNIIVAGRNMPVDNKYDGHRITNGTSVFSLTKNLFKSDYLVLTSVQVLSNASFNYYASLMLLALSSNNRVCIYVLIYSKI
jgi:hypothetical protein